MTSTYLLIKIIRRAVLERTLLPALVLFLAASVLLYLPGENYFFPRPLNSRSNYENFYNKDMPYVSVSVPRLSYTGLTGQTGSHIQGYYYYTLNDGFCQFYLLDAINGFPSSPVRENMQITGRLIRLDDTEYEELLEGMADGLGWTVSSLREMTSPYVISVLPYPIVSVLLFRLLAIGSLLFSGADLLCCLLWYLMPERSPAFSFFRGKEAISRLAARIEPELKSSRFYRTGKLYLVSGTFICADPERPCVIPLSLLSAGKIKQRKITLPGKALLLSGRFILTLKSGTSIRFRKTKKTDPETLLSLIKEQNPDFRIG